MTFVFCVDERMGMSFSGKRQSRDRRLTRDITGERIYIFPYSKALFEGVENVVVIDGTLPREDGGVVFFENVKPDTLDLAERVVIYNWNRHYPADLFFDFDLSEFELEEENTFEGSSHPEIIRRTYKRK